MTILTLDRKKLEREIGKVDDKMKNKISMFGTPVENVTENEISVEVFPNRPDLLSFQGFTRAFLSYLGKKNPPEYKTEKTEKDFKVIIDKSVKKVRPFTACAIVKNLKFDDEKIKEIIDIQEKLHSTVGRNRKKVAIGIYPLEKISLPIKFEAIKPKEIRFVPLDSEREMNGLEILQSHPKGREYAHLLEGMEKFPVFKDQKGKILSMPPIINSNDTGKISESTTEIFIECSGSDF